MAGLLWMLCAVTGSLRISAGFQDPNYLPTLPEDPLQPVWDHLDALPLEILNGFKDQMNFHTRQMQASLTEVLSRLSSLEDKVQQEVTTLREEIGDLVTDRLVNAETMILEGISKLSSAMTSSVKENCDIQDNATSLIEKLGEMVNATVTMATTTCSTRIEEETVRVEEAAAKVEAVAARMEDAATKVEETATKVEEEAARVAEEVAMVEGTATRVEEMASSVKDGNRTRLVSATEWHNTQMNAVYLPRDCSDIHWQQPEALSGLYQTFPTIDPKAPVQTFCDMGTTGAKETGGWTVVLRRHNSSGGLENFNRSWVEYREGFGQPETGEWWYGLSSLHALTYRQPFEVEFTLHDLELGTFQAAYTTLRVESEGSDFRLLISGFSGNVSYDALAYMHHGEPFSTYDKDLDSFDEENCASNNGGGWWYKRCDKAALTATFPTTLDRDSYSICWYRPDDWLVLDDVVMKIRPTNYDQRFYTYANGE